MNDVFVLRYERRPWTLNTERAGRGGGMYKRAKLVREWRAKFAELAAEACMPSMHACTVLVVPELRNHVMPDTGACIGAAKAAIDGLVDAGVLVDDGPMYVRRLTFLAPVVTGVDALVLSVRPCLPAAVAS